MIRPIFCNTALHLGVGDQMWLQCLHLPGPLLKPGRDELVALLDSIASSDCRTELLVHYLLCKGMWGLDSLAVRQLWSELVLGVEVCGAHGHGLGRLARLLLDFLDDEESAR